MKSKNWKNPQIEKKNLWAAGLPDFTCNMGKSMPNNHKIYQMTTN
jgi:hypothetical protein